MKFLWKEIPTISLGKLFPKIVGQDMKVFQEWTGRQHNMRKTLMVEADEEQTELIHYLVEKVKNRRLLEKLWGNKVKVTIVLDNKNERIKGSHQMQNKVDMAVMASYSCKHLKYCSSTRMDGIRGLLH